VTHGFAKGRFDDTFSWNLEDDSVGWRELDTLRGNSEGNNGEGGIPSARYVCVHDDDDDLRARLCVLCVCVCVCVSVCE